MQTVLKRDDWVNSDSRHLHVSPPWVLVIYSCKTKSKNAVALKSNLLLSYLTILWVRNLDGWTGHRRNGSSLLQKAYGSGQVTQMAGS